MASMSSVGGAIHACAHGKFPIVHALDWVDLARPGAPTERFQIDADPEAILALRRVLARRVVLRARLRFGGTSATGALGGADIPKAPVIQRQPRSTCPAFLEPDGTNASGVLSDSGCLGMTSGGVRLSRRYPNRLFATRTARATDVARLCRDVVDHVRERSHAELESALFFVDEEGRPIEP
jgi:hypothetical protein